MKYARFIEVFAGVGLGLLTGLLVGLSASPTVGTVLGALIVFSLSWSGYREVEKVKATADESTVRASIALRAGSFGITCALAILGGVRVRTSGSLEPSLLDRREDWIKLDFTKNQANWLVAMQEMARAGIVSGADRKLGALFGEAPDNSGESGMTAPRLLMTDPRAYDDNAEEMIRAYRELGGRWKYLADYLALKNPLEQLAAFEAIHHLFAYREENEE